VNIRNIPEHELARLREKAKEINGASSDNEQDYSTLLTRRLNHEPLQYIEEYVPFYTIQLKVDQRCLIPRPETEYLIELIKENTNPLKSILDIGTGSGCIALMMKALYSNIEVTGADISEEALSIAIENAQLNSLAVNFLQSDLLENIKTENVDLIIANLPYIPENTLESLDKEVIDYEPLIALNGGVDGLEIISRLINQIEDRDISDLTLCLEIDSTKSSQTLDLLSDWKDVKLFKDLAEKDRYVFATR
jgi:release factor glutamine methyltransferase